MEHLHPPTQPSPSPSHDETRSSVRVWQSYSCNNSSSFRLVARFDDPKAAAESAKELDALFKLHAKQADKQSNELFASGGEYNWPPPPTKAMLDIGAKYGFKWKDFLGWGDSELVGDEPTVAAVESSLVVYHSYCGGFPSEIGKILKAKGATKVDNDDWEDPTVTAIFPLPKDPSKAKKLERSLAKLFAQANDPDNEYIDNWKTKPPWSGNRQCDDESENTAFFSDGKTAGFYIAIDPGQLDKLKQYLAKNGVEAPSLRICEEGDLKKLKAIAASTCEACGSKLTYVDPRLNQIETEQLACAKCGGMYDLAEVTKKHAKAAAAAKRKAEAAAKAKAEAEVAEAAAKAKKKKSAAKKPAKKTAKKTAKKAAKKTAKKKTKR